jgi:hypothetical protein
MPRKRKITSDNTFGTIGGLLITSVLIGVRHIFLFSIEVLKFILKCLWRILLFIVVFIIEYFEKRSIRRKTILLNNQMTKFNEPLNPNQHLQLKELYEDYYPKLINSIKSINAFDRKLSYPLLIAPFDNYYKSKEKIMFIGKETRYWILDGQNKFLSENIPQDNVINQLLLNYKQFNFGANYIKSPFWQFCHNLYKEITLADNNDGFIWNNLCKIDENGTTPKWDLMKASTAFYPVIQKEIAILHPDIVIFLTGNTFDQYLKYLFPGLEFDVVNDQFSRVIHSELPFHSYKTSHPKRLRLIGTFDKVIKDLTVEVKKEQPISQNQRSNEVLQ